MLRQPTKNETQQQQQQEENKNKNKTEPVVTLPLQIWGTTARLKVALMV